MLIAALPATAPAPAESIPAPPNDAPTPPTPAAVAPALVAPVPVPAAECPTCVISSLRGRGEWARERQRRGELGGWCA